MIYISFRARLHNITMQQSDSKRYPIIFELWDSDERIQ